MDKRSSILSKMADKLLKSADISDALAQSKAKQQKYNQLHEAMTERYKFYLISKDKHQYADQVRKDIDEVKKFQKKLSLTTQESNTLNRLFAKYRIDY
jgi:nitrate/nitrite-specific signal transduction histidine kinase